MMKDDRPMTWPAGFAPSRDAKVDGLALPEFRALFLSWKPGWDDSEPWKPFPLRQLAPDAAAYMARISRYTQREMEMVAILLDLEKPLDKIALFERFLDVMEPVPFVAPMIDIIIARSRVMGDAAGYFSRRGRKPKNHYALSRVLVGRLALSNLPRIEARLGDLVSGEVGTDLAVGMFCEYALHHFIRMNKVDPKGLQARLREVLSLPDDEWIGGEDDDDEDDGDEQDGDEQDDEDIDLESLPLREFAEGLLTDITGREPDQEEVVQAIGALKTVAGMLTAESPGSDFRLVADLATALAGLLAAAPQASGSDSVWLPDALAGRLEALGIEVPGIEGPGAGINLSGGELDEIDWLLDEAEAGQAQIAALEAEAADAEAGIHLATTERRFADLATLAGLAETTGVALAEARATQDAVLARIGARLAGEVKHPAIAIETDSPTEKPEASVAAEAATLEPAAPEAGNTHAAAAAAAAAAVDANADAAEDGREDATEEDPDEADVAVAATAMASAGIGEATQALSGGEMAISPDDMPDDMPDVAPDAVASAEEILEADAADATMAGAAAEPLQPALEVATDSAEESVAEEEFAAEESAAESGLHRIELVAARPSILANLIERDLLGIAADAAGAIEVHHLSWPVSASVLRAVSAARAPQRDYGPDTQRFANIVERAMGEELRDLESVMLLGGLISAAILQQHELRRRLPPLARGRFGQHLIAVAEAIADLGYDFPPGPDELARLSGTNQVPRRKRLADKLGAWCETMARRRSRWQFASVYMHHVVADDGPIGMARRAIEAGDPQAIALARAAIERLDSRAKVETEAEAFGRQIGRSNDRLYPRGADYLDDHFSEALGYLAEWIRLTETAGQDDRRSEARLRATIGKLGSRLDRAVADLEAEAEAGRLELRELDAAVADWLAARCREARAALAGEDTASFATLEDALSGLRGLLPAAVRRAGEGPDGDWGPLVEFLAESEIPEPAEGCAAARRDGAFEVAVRIAQRFGLPADAGFDGEAKAFAAAMTREVERHQRRLKDLAKVDYAHQGEIGRNLFWCETALARLAAVDGAEVDLSDLPVQSRSLDGVADTIEGNIRDGQAERIGLHRTEKNAEEADELLAALGTLSLQAVEDRIAQLRDGRSAAILRSDAGQLIAQFTPDFVTLAAAPGWPKSIADYRAAFAADGPLHTEEDRRAASIELIEAFHVLGAAGGDRSPSLRAVRDFLELVGFTRVSVGGATRVAGAKAWKLRVGADLVSDGWFLPPVFGSKAAAYDLFLIGPGVLPEVIQAAADPKMPAILVITGVADFARRREYAERLRAGSIAALFIDEALVAFAATHRDTRARTIFECGLPYGRVEPYTTDAGQIPPEMFFGRRAEIADIMSRTADGCLVYGGRQLGKSALLNHIAKQNHAPAEDRIVVRREVKPLGKAHDSSEIWRHLASMLVTDGVVRPKSRSEDEIVHDIHAWLESRPLGQIVCLFDETDNFMAAEAAAGYPELSRLKELMEDTGRAFKVVFAGLHNVKRTLVQPNSPLAHLGRAICIGPLNRSQDDKRAAHDLVVEPMQAAGFRFERDDDVELILAWANYYPSLIQEFLKGLLESLHGVGSGKPYRLRGDGPLWPIPSGELFEHRGFEDVAARVRDKFHLTLDLDPRYALVAYTMAWLNADGDEQGALHTGYRTEDLMKQVMTFWPQHSEVLSRQAFEALLDEMFDLGVLGRVPVPGTTRARYCLASRQVAAMLGSKDDVLQVLEEIEEREADVSYDRTIYRRAYAPEPGREARSEGPYSPLTDLQIEQLATEKGPAVRIVCGLEALGLGKVGLALKRIAEADLGRLPGLPKARPQVTVSTAVTEKELREAVTARIPSKTLALVIYRPAGEQEAQKALAWLETRHEVLSGAVRPVLLLDAADARMRQMAIRRASAPEEGVWLTAWGSEMLRIFLDNIESNRDTKGFRNAILKATGGLPVDTIALVRQAIAASDEQAAIAGWKPSLRDAAGVAGGAVGAALRIIDESRNRDDYEAMDELIHGETGQDLTSIAPDLVAMGLVSGWNPTGYRIRRSALGSLVLAQIDGW